MFDLLFLGTGASVPSRNRALPCVAVKRGSDIVLFDCGEGSQRQLMQSRFSFMKIKAIFITHLHGDHFYGLPGLLQTMGMSGRKDPLIVCGPEGLKDALTTCLNVCEGEIEYPVDIRDVKPNDVIEVNDMKVTVFKTEHEILSQGYVIREPDPAAKVDKVKAAEYGISGRDFRVLEKGGVVNGISMKDIILPQASGRSVAYTGDTIKCNSVIEAVRGVDVLIHESTYSSSEEGHAIEHNHSTAAWAAEVAKEAGVGTLVLTHISNRYKDREILLKEATEIFPNTLVPSDFDLYIMTKNGIRLT